MASCSRVRMSALVVACVLLSACGGGDQGAATDNGRSQPDAISEPAEGEAFHETSSCEDEEADVASSTKVRNPGQRAEDLTSVQLEVTDEELTATFETSTPLPDTPAQGGELWMVFVYEDGAREPLFSLTAVTSMGTAGLEGKISDDFDKKQGFTSSRPVGDAQTSDAGIVMTTAIADLPEVPARIAWSAVAAATTDDTYVDVCPGRPTTSFILSPRQLGTLPTLQMPASS